MDAREAPDARPLGRVLVTGAPGFLGGAICRVLVEHGARVRGLALVDEPLDNLAGLDVEIVRGDVRDRSAVEAAIDGVQTVIHTAAIYESWMPDPTAMYEVNLRGTFNVLEAARRAGVRQVVDTASIVALGRPTAGSLASEDTPYEAWDLDFAYSRSKHLSLWLARDFAGWGLDVRVICPGIVIGPGDRRPTPSGRMLLALAQGKAPGWTAGGAAYVDVRDAAMGHLLAALRGRAGEVYVVVGHNLDNRALVHAVAHACGRRFRGVPIPVALARAWVAALERIAVLRGTQPDLSRVFFEYGLRACFYDNGKSVRDLGLAYRPFDDTLADALADFRERGWLG